MNDNWNKKLAGDIAKEDNIELTQLHWAVINILREFYQEYEMHPTMRVLIKKLKEKEYTDINSSKLYQLFPEGPIKQGSKIAGLPKPTKCID